jgi:hypothetical protein
MLQTHRERGKRVTKKKKKTSDHNMVSDAHMRECRIGKRAERCWIERGGGSSLWEAAEEEKKKKKKKKRWCWSRVNTRKCAVAKIWDCALTIKF